MINAYTRVSLRRTDVGNTDDLFVNKDAFPAFARSPGPRVLERAERPDLPRLRAGTMDRRILGMSGYVRPGPVRGYGSPGLAPRMGWLCLRNGNGHNVVGHRRLVGAGIGVPRNLAGKPCSERCISAVRPTQARPGSRSVRVRAGTISSAERMVPARRALPALEPPPVLSGRPALAANRVRLATVAARYNWNFVLARPK